MSGRPRGVFSFAESFVGGLLVVYLLGGVLRPLQSDFTHTIGVLTARGGVVVHEGQLKMGRDLWGRYTVMITAVAAPPVAGDIEVRLVGPTLLDYTVSSRYPPLVPLSNGFHPWYRFENSTMKGVAPGDSIILTVQMKPPSAPGSYTITFADPGTGRIYLAMPVVFVAAGDSREEILLPASDCPGCQ